MFINNEELGTDCIPPSNIYIYIYMRDDLFGSLKCVVFWILSIFKNKNES